MKKVLLIGDSHLARLNRIEEGDPGRFFKRELPSIEIVDLSSGGANVRDGYEALSEYTLEKEGLAFVMFGTNDAASWKQVPIDEFKSKYSEIVKTLSSKKVKTVVVTPPPVDTDKQTPPGRSNETLNQYSEVVRKVANNSGVVLIDLFTLISIEMKKNDIHLKDGVHLDRDGYKILINEMKKLINNLQV